MAATACARSWPDRPRACCGAPAPRSGRRAMPAFGLGRAGRRRTAGVLLASFVVCQIASWRNYFALKSRKNTIYWKSACFGHTALSTLGTIAALFNDQVNNGPTNRNDRASDGRTNRNGRVLRPARLREQNARGHSLCGLPLRAQAPDASSMGMSRKRPDATYPNKWAPGMEGRRDSATSFGRVLMGKSYTSPTRPQPTNQLDPPLIAKSLILMVGLP